MCDPVIGVTGNHCAELHAHIAGSDSTDVDVKATFLKAHAFNAEVPSGFVAERTGLEPVETST
jgi:hypothetical protein